MNPDLGRPKKVAPLPPPSRKPKAIMAHHKILTIVLCTVDLVVYPSYI